MKKLFKYLGLALLLYLAYAGFQAYTILDQAEVFKTAVYESKPPLLDENLADNSILVFSKTNEFRHHEAIAAANKLFQNIADKHNLSIVFTENGAIHNSEQLNKFKVIIWNNNTGDVLSAEQRTALKNYIEQGGHWFGIHGAGGSRDYQWRWYPEQLLKATFIGHPLFPQFQRAVIDVENNQHPSTKHLPERWQRTEEWYSFETSPRANGVDVLASLDESTYAPKLDLLMDNDHPLIWTHKIGDGIVFYSALGHNGSAYEEPEYRQLLENTLLWLMTE